MSALLRAKACSVALVAARLSADDAEVLGEEEEDGRRRKKRRTRGIMEPLYEGGKRRGEVALVSGVRGQNRVRGGVEGGGGGGKGVSLHDTADEPATPAVGGGGLGQGVDVAAQGVQLVDNGVLLGALAGGRARCVPIIDDPESVYIYFTRRDCYGKDGVFGAHPGPETRVRKPEELNDSYDDGGISRGYMCREKREG